MAEMRFAEFLGGLSASASMARFARALEQDDVHRVVLAAFGSSPYLSGLIRRDPGRLQRVFANCPEAHMQWLVRELKRDFNQSITMVDAMHLLRQFKAEAALLIALADIADLWDLEQVTGALTKSADTALKLSVRLLLRLACERGEVMASSADKPEEGSGYIVIAMGKYGAYELNYSSDIDLIIFFERGSAQVRPDLDAQSVFVKITRQLVRLMQEQTGEGYVFRTDLRLRPDPGSTQVVLSTEAALHYYEALGQNWERAALIKARPVAGDVPAGEEFLAQLAPFVWRKYLDYAAIADIHAMKRQIHTIKGFGAIGVAGHNIKLGRGGIREIEFFAQTQQLIAGGRQPDLRVPQTRKALTRLAKRGWITQNASETLDAAYTYLRRIEHRLQMIADEQTHTLPSEKERLVQLAHFAGYETYETFEKELRTCLERVQHHYGELFEDLPELTNEAGNLVFTGDSDDPATVETLGNMGYAGPSSVIQTVKGWHFGRYPAVRSEKARQRLTEFQPVLLEALADTDDPSKAIATFDRFLSELPAGVQLFSLLRNNPNLLRLLADIMGTAPRLATTLSRRGRTLEAVLDPGFFGALPSSEELERIVFEGLSAAPDYQDCLDRARVIGREQSFLIGVRVLSGTITAEQAGVAYAALASRLISALQSAVERELESRHGAMPGGAASVIGMGKLGGREMTASSDLDLILVYDFDQNVKESDGIRPLASGQYYARLTQRLISAISAPTAEGTLYEVDMRLRPSGNAGPVATQLGGFINYHHDQAWTWEHMALTRARVITGPRPLRSAIDDSIFAVLTKKRDREKVAEDVRDMRQRILLEKGADTVWDLKQVRGGLVDLEFIVQFLQLVNAHDQPSVLRPGTQDALGRLAEAECLTSTDAEVLIPAARLLHSLTQVLRVCLDGPFDADKAPRGLKNLLAQAGEKPSFDRLEEELKATLRSVHQVFQRTIV